MGGFEARALLLAAALATAVWALFHLVRRHDVPAARRTPAGKKGLRTMLQKKEVEDLFQALEEGRVAKPEETLAVLKGVLGDAAREGQWGVACLIALAGYRIDAGKKVDLPRIDRDMTQLFAAWDR